MVLEPVTCPVCGGIDVVKYGQASNGKQRFLCQEPPCACQTFIQGYSEKGRLPHVKQQILDMALNGSGVRDTARVLGISPTTVISELKKRNRRCGR
jgi:insertion element IS1 protein InsB